MQLAEILQRFEKEIPLSLQESWDHCGLSLGSRRLAVKGVLFSYDVCLEVVRDAIRRNCQLIVSHHPFRMRAGVMMDLDEYENRIISACIKAGVALYTAHTNHDRSQNSLNRFYLRKLGLKRIKPLVPHVLPDGRPSTVEGMGATGQWERPVRRVEMIRRLKALFQCPVVRFVDGGRRDYRRAGICTGSGTSLLPQAVNAGCDVFITGDVKYHQGVEAKRHDLAVADVGHFYSEMKAPQVLRDVFRKCFGAKLRLHLYTGLRDAFELV